MESFKFTVITCTMTVTLALQPLKLSLRSVRILLCSGSWILNLFVYLCGKHKFNDSHKSRGHVVYLNMFYNIGKF